MNNNQQVKLLLNDDQRHHGHAIAQLLRGAKRLDCVVAFAKTSGLGLILKELVKALKAGLEARFAIGLDFYLTEPELLRSLLKLSGNHRLKLYISRSSCTFHPKIYALSYGKGGTVLIGSANLTSGGLQNNYEASARIDEPNDALTQAVRGFIDDLIEQEELVQATKEDIDEYQRLHRLHEVLHNLNAKRFDRAKPRTGMHMEILHDILQEMKNDTSEDGFQSHKIRRSKNREAAAGKIKALARMTKLKASTFRTRYEQLIQQFHSGGLHRGKDKIAKKG
jgi:HKD family nuclease